MLRYGDVVLVEAAWPTRGFVSASALTAEVHVEHPCSEEAAAQGRLPANHHDLLFIFQPAPRLLAPTFDTASAAQRGCLSAGSPVHHGDRVHLLHATTGVHLCPGHLAQGIDDVECGLGVEGKRSPASLFTVQGKEEGEVSCEHTFTLYSAARAAFVAVKRQPEPSETFFRTADHRLTVNFYDPAFVRLRAYLDPKKASGFRAIRFRPFDTLHALYTHDLVSVNCPEGGTQLSAHSEGQGVVLDQVAVDGCTHSLRSLWVLESSQRTPSHTPQSMRVSMAERGGTERASSVLVRNFMTGSYLALSSSGEWEVDRGITVFATAASEHENGLSSTLLTPNLIGSATITRAAGQSSASSAQSEAGAHVLFVQKIASITVQHLSFFRTGVTKMRLLAEYLSAPALLPEKIYFQLFEALQAFRSFASSLAAVDWLTAQTWMREALGINALFDVLRLAFELASPRRRTADALLPKFLMVRGVLRDLLDETLALAIMVMKGNPRNSAYAVQWASAVVGWSISHGAHRPLCLQLLSAIIASTTPEEQASLTRDLVPFLSRNLHQIAQPEKYLDIFRGMLRRKDSAQTDLIGRLFLDSPSPRLLSLEGRGEGAIVLLRCEGRCSEIALSALAGQSADIVETSLLLLGELARRGSRRGKAAVESRLSQQVACDAFASGSCLPQIRTAAGQYLHAALAAPAMVSLSPLRVLRIEKGGAEVRPGGAGVRKSAAGVSLALAERFLVRIEEVQHPLAEVCCRLLALSLCEEMLTSMEEVTRLNVLIAKAIHAYSMELKASMKGTLSSSSFMVSFVELATCAALGAMKRGEGGGLSSLKSRMGVTPSSHGRLRAKEPELMLEGLAGSKLAQFLCLLLRHSHDETLLLKVYEIFFLVTDAQSLAAIPRLHIEAPRDEGMAHNFTTLREICRELLEAIDDPLTSQVEFDHRATDCLERLYGVLLLPGQVTFRESFPEELNTALEASLFEAVLPASIPTWHEHGNHAAVIRALFGVLARCIACASETQMLLRHKVYKVLRLICESSRLAVKLVVNHHFSELCRDLSTSNAALLLRRLLEKWPQCVGVERAAEGITALGSLITAETSFPAAVAALSAGALASQLHIPFAERCNDAMRDALMQNANWLSQLSGNLVATQIYAKSVTTSVGMHRDGCVVSFGMPQRPLSSSASPGARATQRFTLRTSDARITLDQARISQMRLRIEKGTQPHAQRIDDSLFHYNKELSALWAVAGFLHCTAPAGLEAQHTALIAGIDLAKACLPGAHPLNLPHSSCLLKIASLRLKRKAREELEFDGLEDIASFLQAQVSACAQVLSAVKGDTYFFCAGRFVSLSEIATEFVSALVEACRLLAQFIKANEPFLSEKVLPTSDTLLAEMRSALGVGMASAALRDETFTQLTKLIESSTEGTDVCGLLANSSTSCFSQECCQRLWKVKEAPTLRISGSSSLFVGSLLSDPQALACQGRFLLEHKDGILPSGVAKLLIAYWADQNSQSGLFELSQQDFVLRLLCTNLPPKSFIKLTSLLVRRWNGEHPVSNELAGLILVVPTTRLAETVKCIVDLWNASHIHERYSCKTPPQSPQGQAIEFYLCLGHAILRNAEYVIRSQLRALEALVPQTSAITLITEVTQWLRALACMPHTCVFAIATTGMKILRLILARNGSECANQLHQQGLPAFIWHWHLKLQADNNHGERSPDLNASLHDSMWHLLADILQHGVTDGRTFFMEPSTLAAALTRFIEFATESCEGAGLPIKKASNKISKRRSGKYYAAICLHIIMKANHRAPLEIDAVHSSDLHLQLDRLGIDAVHIKHQGEVRQMYFQPPQDHYLSLDLTRCLLRRAPCPSAIRGPSGCISAFFIVEESLRRERGAALKKLLLRPLIIRMLGALSLTSLLALNVAVFLALTFSLLTTTQHVFILPGLGAVSLASEALILLRSCWLWPVLSFRLFWLNWRSCNAHKLAVLADGEIPSRSLPLDFFSLHRLIREIKAAVSAKRIAMKELIFASLGSVVAMLYHCELFSLLNIVFVITFMAGGPAALVAFPLLSLLLRFSRQARELSLIICAAAKSYVLNVLPLAFLLYYVASFGAYLYFVEFIYVLTPEAARSLCPSLLRCLFNVVLYNIHSASGISAFVHPSLFRPIRAWHMFALTLFCWFCFMFLNFLLLKAAIPFVMEALEG